jgi:uncharacterized repeat protein (TIGR03803 family)
VVVLSGQELKHVPPASPSFTVLYNFTGGADGGNPYAGLIRDAAGNLYGTAVDGSGGCFFGGQGCGTVFKLGPTGSETTLYSFGGADGGDPVAALVQDAAGNLYGTTVNGGASGFCRYGCGTVFKLRNLRKIT